MRKFCFLFIFIICFSPIFSKEVTFNFNVPVGKIEYFKSGDMNTQGQEFYEGSVTLDLDKTDYYFLFTSNDYPYIQKVLNIKESNSPIDIVFDEKDFAVVKGSVKSKASKLGNVKVSFINAENHSYNFTTDMFGDYVAYIPPGNYKVTAERIGYSLNEDDGIIHEFNSKLTPYSFDLNLTELPSYIQGHVVDSEGQGIPFPLISIKNGSDIIRLKGDSMGLFEIPIKSGIATILCQKKGYIQNGTVRKIEKDSYVSNIEITLTRARYSITGTVFSDTKALSGLKLQLMTRDYNKIATTTSSENGFFEFYKIPGDRKVFIMISKDNKIIKRSELINLDKDIKNFNILLKSN